MERWFRDFLWGSRQDGHGIHLLAWDSVCMPISEGGLGIQSLIARREALIAKHATRFLMDTECLWSSFMRAKYGDWSTHVPFQSARGYSFFWKEVCRHAPAVLSGISWMIGNGMSVDVLRDTWLADLPLSRWPTFISTDLPSDCRVSDLLLQDHTAWHTSLIATLFGVDLQRRILSIPLLSDHTSDTRLWRRSCLSRVPIRDLIQDFRPQTSCTLDIAWIWRLPIHPRVRLFIWKMAWDCLPTCSLLSRRGMEIQSTCPLCGTEEETTDHAIFTCSRARLAWQIAGYCSSPVSSAMSRSSFMIMLRQEMRRDAGRSSTAAYLAYQVWLSRNRHIFSAVMDPPQRIIRTAISLSAEYTRHQSALDSDSPSFWDSPAASAADRGTVFISWEPPPLGFVKVNFDGSVQGRLAGSAFVIRRSDGVMLAAGGFGLLDLSVPSAELHAAWAGICFAVRSLGIRRLIIEGDSVTVVRWLLQDLGVPCSTNPLISDIRSMLRQIDEVQIRHIYREANSAADWVASRVAHHSGPWYWVPGDSCPVMLSQILYSDFSGLTHPRSV